MSAAEGLRLAVGLAEVGLAAFITWRIRDLLPRLPWLLLLTVFFAVRGADRIYGAFSGGSQSDAWLYASDALLLISLVLLATGLERSTAILRAVVERTHARHDAYHRALSDYRTLVRHRLANPLTVLSGGIATLLAMPDLGAAERQALLEAMRREVERLERISLEPLATEPEESDLLPDIGDHELG